MNTNDDLGDSLKITKTEGRQLNAGGTWVSGTIAGHTFQVLVFEDHAENEEYELGTSRISKLWLRRQADRQVVVTFDRGCRPGRWIRWISTRWRSGRFSQRSGWRTGWDAKTETHERHLAHHLAPRRLLIPFDRSE